MDDKQVSDLDLQRMLTCHRLFTGLRHAPGQVLDTKSRGRGSLFVVDVPPRQSDAPSGELVIRPLVADGSGSIAFRGFRRAADQRWARRVGRRRKPRSEAVGVQLSFFAYAGIDLELG